MHDDTVEMQTFGPLAESDPHGRNPHTAGAKLDAGKAPIWRGLLDYFPRALQQVALVSEFGSRKYTWKGWETVPGGEARYADAMARHVIAEAIEGPVTPDSELLHAAHIAWNALAVLELKLRSAETAARHE